MITAIVVWLVIGAVVVIIARRHERFARVLRVFGTGPPERNATEAQVDKYPALTELARRERQPPARLGVDQILLPPSRRWPRIADQVTSSPVMSLR
jgi:hypothetical protein